MPLFKKPLFYLIRSQSIKIVTTGNFITIQLSHFIVIVNALLCLVYKLSYAIIYTYRMKHRKYKYHAQTSSTRGPWISPRRKYSLEKRLSENRNMIYLICKPTIIFKICFKITDGSSRILIYLSSFQKKGTVLLSDLSLTFSLPKKFERLSSKRSQDRGCTAVVELLPHMCVSGSDAKKQTKKAPCGLRHALCISVCISVFSLLKVRTYLLGKGD